MNLLPLLPSETWPSLWVISRQPLMCCWRPVASACRLDPSSPKKRLPPNMRVHHVLGEAQSFSRVTVSHQMWKYKLPWWILRTVPGGGRKKWLLTFARCVNVINTSLFLFMSFPFLGGGFRSLAVHAAFQSSMQSIFVILFFMFFVLTVLWVY